MVKKSTNLAKYAASKGTINEKAIIALKTPLKTPRRGKKPKDNINRLWDDKIRGFHVVCRTTGAKSYYLLYTNKVSRKKISLHLGTYPELKPTAARSMATIEAGKVAAGRCPYTERKHEVKIDGSLEEFVEEYRGILPKTKSRPTELKYLKRYIVPHLGKMRLRDIDQNDIMRWRNKWEDTPDTANHIKSYLYKFFQWCKTNHKKTGIINNPVGGIKNLKVKKRSFYMSDVALAKLSHVLMQKKDKYPMETIYIGLLICTGARPSEIYALKWNEVDLELSALVGIETKTGTITKQISSTAVKLFRRLLKITGEGTYCFPSDRGNKTHRTDFRTAWYEIREEAGLGKERQLRDLRHHFATYLLKKTGNIVLVSKALNHKSIKITADVYADVLAESEIASLEKTAKGLQVMFDKK